MKSLNQKKSGVYRLMIRLILLSSCHHVAVAGVVFVVAVSVAVVVGNKISLVRLSRSMHRI